MIRHRAHELAQFQPIGFGLGRGLRRNNQWLTVAMPRDEARREVDRGGDDDEARQRRADAPVPGPAIPQERRRRGDQEQEGAEERVVDVVETEEHAAQGESDPRAARQREPAGRHGQRGDAGHRHEKNRETEVLDVARQRVGQQREENAPTVADRGETRARRRQAVAMIDESTTITSQLTFRTSPGSAAKTCTTQTMA